MGETLMEIDKNKNIYHSLTLVTQVITEKDIWENNTTLLKIIESFNKIAKECESYCKYLTDDSSKKDNGNKELYDDIIKTNQLLINLGTKHIEEK